MSPRCIGCTTYRRSSSSSSVPDANDVGLGAEVLTSVFPSRVRMSLRFSADQLLLSAAATEASVPAGAMGLTGGQNRRTARHSAVNRIDSAETAVLLACGIPCRPGRLALSAGAIA